MERNHIIGFALIFILFYIWMAINSPSQEELEAEKRRQDSIAMVDSQPVEESEFTPEFNNNADQSTTSNDSISEVALAGFGPFAESATGTESLHTLENELFKITLSNKGGQIVEVELKEYNKIRRNEAHEKIVSELKLLDDEKNQFDYELPLAGMNQVIRTGDLYFEQSANDKSIVYRASAGNGRYFEQKYTIKDGSYGIDYDISLVGLNQVIKGNESNLKLKWTNYLDKLETNDYFERFYSSVYFKETDENSDYCNCRSDDVEDKSEKKINWVSNSNQFFNSALIAKNDPFDGGVFETVMLDKEEEDLKKLISTVYIPYGQSSNESFSMDFYIGPNKYKILKEYGHDFEQIIPFGRSIFGTINRYMIRPFFNFLFGLLGSAGLAIIVMITIIKFMLYPLLYKMLASQSKMGALKPEIAEMKEKFKDDPQKQQMETMKLYREFGVSPLGGCMPMLVQMPIWYAMFRFFPAFIDFRQQPFLWSDDLSSFDVFFWLPDGIGFDAFGYHVSAFAILWAVTTVIYTYYNTKHMDMSAQPMMKYFQYAMPVMFFGFFNNYASGLTIYMFLSNLINILQTIFTKKFIFNEDKIREELYANKSKPKKKSKFQARLEDAMKQQQQQQAARKKK